MISFLRRTKGELLLHIAPTPRGYEKKGNEGSVKRWVEKEKRANVFFPPFSFLFFFFLYIYIYGINKCKGIILYAQEFSPITPP